MAETFNLQNIWHYNGEIVKIKIKETLNPKKSREIRKERSAEKNNFGFVYPQFFRRKKILQRRVSK